MMYALNIEGLSKTFIAKKRHKVEALKGVSLQIEQGEVFGFLGPNGAGKSTTIKCLMGLITPTSGGAQIMGMPIGSEASRQKVGYLPENPTFYEYLTAEEYLQFVGHIFKMPQQLLERRSEETLKLLELWDARKRQIRSYSKGMVQRVGLAQVLIHDPDVYILDEPMSGLDPIGRALVKDIIINLKKRGKTIFFSTHVTADVEALCDRIAILRDGRLEAIEIVKDIMGKGITGYTVHISNCHPDVCGTAITNISDVKEYYITKDKFNTFMERIIHTGGIVHLVEPHRCDLETFFLKIVNREQNDVE